MGRTAQPAPDRFWSRVVEQPDGCWLWTGYCKPNGYGQFSIGRQKVRAHRFAYEQVVGLIPAGLTVDHLCRNPSCVNPAHMEVVTLAENIGRGRNANVTHCPRGHPYDAANTIILARGAGRRCRTCQIAWSRTRRARKKAQDG